MAHIAPFFICAPASSPHHPANCRYPGSGRAFSLPEILVILAVLGVLLSAGVGAFAPLQAKSQRVRAEAELRVIRQGLETFRADFGDYPLTGACPTLPAPASTPPVGETAEVKVFNALTGRLDARLRPLPGRGKRYLNPHGFSVASRDETADPASPEEVLSALVDPWGNPYRYRYRSSPTAVWRASTCLVYSLGPDGREVAPIDGAWDTEALENRDNIHG